MSKHSCARKRKIAKTMIEIVKALGLLMSGLAALINSLGQLLSK